MRQALGKGLEALLGGETLPGDNNFTAAAAGNGVQKIEISKIIPNRYQPRKTFKEEALRDLAESIKRHGLTQPVVVVYDSGLDKYELVVGERRLRASEIAGLTEIEAIIHPALDEKQLCALALIENIQREDLNPIETALGYKSLIQKFNISQNEVGEYCGKSKAAVSNSLRLLALGEDIQKALAEGALTEGHARSLLMLPDGPKREALFKKLLSGKMSVRQAEAAAKALLSPQEAKKAAKSSDTAAFEQSLQEALGSRVELKQSAKKGKGTLVLHYDNLDQLDRIADKLKHSL